MGSVMAVQSEPADRERRRKRPRFNGEIMDVFEASRDFVCLCRDGDIVDVNSAGLDFLGIEGPGRLLGWRFVDLLIPEYAEAFDFLLATREAENMPVPVRVVTFHGETKDIDLQVFRAREIAADAVIVIGRDISHEGRLAGLARSDRARFTALVDNAMNLVCHVVAGKIHYINRSGVALLGAIDADFVIGCGLADLLHGDYADLAAPENIDLLIAEMGPVAMRLRRLDGGNVDAQVMITRLPSEHGDELMIEACDISTHLHTVTSLRQSTETLLENGRRMRELQAELAAREIGIVRRRLSEAQRVARIGTLERNEQGGWRLCPHAASLLNLESQTVDDLHALLTSVLADDRVEVIGALSDFPANMVDIEFSIPTASEPRIVHAVGSAFTEAPDEAFITLQDVTARRAIEKERERMRARAEEASRLESLGTLAGGIAHEINTPAQCVGDNLQFLGAGTRDLLDVAQLARQAALGRAMLSDLAAKTEEIQLDFLASEMPAAAEGAKDGIERISTIVRAVKEACYPSSTDPKPFDLNRMLESVMTVTRASWKYVAELAMELDPGLPPIAGIEGEINQVAMNLVINAAHAIEEKAANASGHIRVSTRRNGHWAVLSVGDDGVGIPSENQQKIFDLFFTTNPPGKGTGQGLAITNAIVRRHGGKIELSSEIGRGTRFDVHLPLDGLPPGGAQVRVGPQTRGDAG